MNRQVEDIDPALLPQLLSLNDDEVLLPLRVKREDVTQLKAVKLTKEELQRAVDFQAHLHNRGFIPDNTFASMFVYLFNLAWTRHREAAEEEAKQEGGPE